MGISRVCVKASPAFGRRRLDTNTDYIVLASAAARLTPLALGWRTPPPALFIDLGGGVGAKIDRFSGSEGGSHLKVAKTRARCSACHSFREDVLWRTICLLLWEDDHGVVHNIHQAEGGEQGDALMPLLFALGQHAALVEVQSQLIPGTKLMAFLDDIYVVTRPERIGAVYVSLQNELLAHSGIRIHGGKTRVWNSGGVRPPACDALERIARAADADENVWRGSQLPLHEQSIKVLGTPPGHPEFVLAHLDRITTEH